MTLIPLEHAEQDTLHELTHKIVTVHDDTSAGITCAELAKINQFRKALETKYKALRKPFEDGLKQLKTEFGRLLAPLEQAETTRRTALLTYREHALAQSAQAYRQAQQTYGQAVQAATRQGQPIEDIPVPLPVAVPAAGFKTDHGTVSARRVQDFTVADASQVPLYIFHHGERLDLWTLHDANIRKIRRDVGDGPSPIPGITFGYKETISVR